MGVLSRIKQGAEAGWEGIKETIEKRSFIEGGKAVERYLKETSKTEYQNTDRKCIEKK